MTTTMGQKADSVVSAINSENYVRVQCVSDIALDDTADSDLLIS